MDYFECDVPEGDGLCSDNACPCPDVVIPRGTGYLYIEQWLVDFRRQYPSLADARRAKDDYHRHMVETFSAAGASVSGLYCLGPILVCKQGASRRNLDLEVAAADAKHWWKTGLVPLRTTPLSGAERQPGKIVPRPQSSDTCPICGYIYHVLDKSAQCPRCAAGAPPTRPSSQPSIPTPVHPGAVAHAPLLPERAGFWARLVAYVIDLFITLLGSSALAALMWTPRNSRDADARAAMLWLFLGAVYHVALNGSFGATLGKMAMRIRIVQADGRLMSFRAAAARYVLQRVFAIPTLGMAYLSVAFDDRKLSWYDRFAGTRVVGELWHGVAPAGACDRCGTSGGVARYRFYYGTKVSDTKWISHRRYLKTTTSKVYGEDGACVCKDCITSYRRRRVAKSIILFLPALTFLGSLRVIPPGKEGDALRFGAVLAFALITGCAVLRLATLEDAGYRVAIELGRKRLRSYNWFLTPGEYESFSKGPRRTFREY